MLGSISEKRRGTSYRANHNSTLKIPSLNFNGETCFGSLTYPPPPKKKNINACIPNKQASLPIFSIFILIIHIKMYVYIHKV